VSKEFCRVDADDIKKLYNKGIICKGSLMKYRWNSTTLNSYQLDSTDNDWRFGIVLDIVWYVMKPEPSPLMESSSNYTDNPDGMLCHEISVIDTADSKRTLLDPRHYEIFILDQVNKE
tara:strand:- start:487 stop:840 length:354 start_codon:yes stop_codon:yes gene_type:complete